MFKGLLSILRNAFIEIVRQPIYAILLSVGLMLIATSPIITSFTLMEDVKLTVDMGLGTIFTVGLILSVLGTTQVISDEISSKTAGTVISKPVGRAVFIVGKFFGVILALFVVFYLLSLMLLMTVRMGVPTTAAFELDMPVLLAQTLPFLLAVAFGIYCNYFFRTNFTAAAVGAAFFLYSAAFMLLLIIGKGWRFEWIAYSFRGIDIMPVLLASLAVFFGIMVIASVALAASTRVNVVANIMICLTVFFVGMISSHLFGWTVDTSWVRWEPVEAAASATISGRITDEAARPLEGVKLAGAPGHPESDRSGNYSFSVNAGRPGELRPKKQGFRFRPESRSYSTVDEDLTGQDFEAVAVPATFTTYASQAWRTVARGAYYATPSLQLFWIGDQIMRPAPYIPFNYVAAAGLYSLLWCFGMVAFAAFLFEGRELV